MHILMVTNNYTPYSGGVVSSINATVLALQKRGHRVTLVTLDFLGTDHDDPAWVKRLACPIKFLYKKNHMAIAWRANKQLKKLFDELKPDVVHVHHPFLLGPIAARIAKSKEIRTVFTYHTMYEAYAHYLFLPALFTKPFIRHRVLSFCSEVNDIIAPSTAIKAYLESEKIKTPVCVIPSGLQDLFCANELDLRSKEGNCLRLLTVGRMVKEKNIECLLRVAASLKAKNISFTLTLVGYGAEYEPLQDYAFNVLKLSSEQILFVHQPPKDLILRFYRESDLFLFSSHTDTQGLVLAEAMACGLPVIALDGPGQRDIIVQGCNGFIVDSEQEMVAHIIALQVNPPYLSELSIQAYVTARRYHPEKLVERLLDVYHHSSTEPGCVA